MPNMPESAPTEPSESPGPGNRREPEIDVLATSRLWDAQAPHLLLRKAARVAISGSRWGDTGWDFGGAELAIELADDRRIADLNARFRERPGPTNVLSFPAFEPPGLETALRQATMTGQPLPFGDVILAFETIEREAADQGKPFTHHLAHLVIHGVLHCLGYNHQDMKEAEIMEALERRCLARLGVPDPYAAPEDES